MKILYPWLLLLTLMGCASKPPIVEPVSDFALEPYLGKWYEMARLDHSFERGLSQVTATYSLRDDGGVRVTNKGYKASKGRWSQAEGKAYFAGEDDVGHLKVSFFGPFYGAYVIFELDKDYQYAFVAGPNTKYLWLLSRTTDISPELQAQFVQAAKANGFDTDSLIWVEHP